MADPVIPLLLFFLLILLYCYTSPLKNQLNGQAAELQAVNRNSNISQGDDDISLTARVAALEAALSIEQVESAALDVSCRKAAQCERLLLSLQWSLSAAIARWSDF
jgi:hypothetical protein